MLSSGFYHQSLDGGRFIDFGLLLRKDVYGDVFDLEMGKVSLF